MLDAKCRGMGQDLFFPKRGGGKRKGKLVCEQCSVRRECRDYAERTNTHYGIWGGEVLSKESASEPEEETEQVYPDESNIIFLTPPPAVIASSNGVLPVAATGNTALPQVVGFSKAVSPSLPLLPPD